MTNSKEKGGISWTFVFQALTLTFNLSFVVHLILAGELPVLSLSFLGINDSVIIGCWELVLITFLSMLTTFWKLKDYDECQRKGLKNLAAITMLAFVTSLVADLHFIPALSVINFPASFMLMVGIVVGVIAVVLILAALEKLEWKWEIFKNLKTFIVISSVLIIIAVGVGYELGSEISKLEKPESGKSVNKTMEIEIKYPEECYISDSEKCYTTGNQTRHLEIPIDVPMPKPKSEDFGTVLSLVMGALIANLISTILVIYEKILEGRRDEKPEDVVKDKSKKLDKEIEEMEEKIKKLTEDKK